MRTRGSITNIIPFDEIHGSIHMPQWTASRYPSVTCNFSFIQTGVVDQEEGSSQVVLVEVGPNLIEPL